MTGLFLKFLNMSISASWIVLAVVLLRFFMKKTPRWIVCLLWGVVALRLLVPVTMESVLSLIPSPEVFPQEIITSQTPAIHSGIPVVNSTVNPMLTQQVIEGTNTLDMVLLGATVAWVTGAVLMLGYGLVSSIVLRRQVSAYIPGGENIRLCDQVFSPFVLGIFRPKIYIPSGLDDKTMEYVLSHEQAHIQRKDHWWKPLGFLLLSLHWFNPLLWLAYILLCRDIERACDEKVIDGMTAAEKKGYSGALLACSVHRRMIMACPVAFGEIGIKARIKGVAGYRRPVWWKLAVAGLLCALTAVCFLTNPAVCLHDYSGVVVAKATCSHEGMENRTCKYCAHSYSVPVEKLAHTYDAGVVVTQPTCVAHGMLEYTCTGCGEKKQVALEKIPHTVASMTVIKSPNCTQEGQAVAACGYCGVQYNISVATNDSHDFVETVIRESTCTKQGEEIRICTRCSYSELVTYEMAEHTNVKGVCDSGNCRRYGSQAWFCVVCHQTTVTQTTLGDHQWHYRSAVPWSKTCTVECWICGKTKTEANPDYDPNLHYEPYDMMGAFSGNQSTEPTFPVVQWDLAYPDIP